MCCLAWVLGSTFEVGSMSMRPRCAVLLVLDRLVHILKQTCMVGAQSINTRRGGSSVVHSTLFSPWGCMGTEYWVCDSWEQGSSGLQIACTISLGKGIGESPDHECLWWGVQWGPMWSCSLPQDLGLAC